MVYSLPRFLFSSYDREDLLSGGKPGRVRGRHAHASSSSAPQVPVAPPASTPKTLQVFVYGLLAYNLP